MVDITREGLFILDSAIVHTAVLHCLPYTRPPPYKFLEVIYMSVYLSVFLMWWCEQTIVILQGYMCTYIFFYSFDFYLWPFYFIFCVLPFCVLSFVFRKVSFLYCLLPFILHFNFQLFTFVFFLKLLYFGFSYASSMLKMHPSTPSNFGSRQTYRQTHRQLIAFRIWEGGGNRLIDRYVLHLMPSNVRLHFIRPAE